MTANRIFISYARADGADLAARIRQRLEHAQLGVWRDLPDMQPGRDFWLQIEQVLRDPVVEHLILVPTPGAIASGCVRDEWRYDEMVGTYRATARRLERVEADQARLAPADLILATESAIQSETQSWSAFWSKEP